ncbi:MAG: DNA helicase RecQ [Firmicutes bacterium]|nr:DNA helicase RecQ [Bacillota bacterium]
MDKRYEILKQCFGYTSFRDGQEELIDAVLSGRDALGIMPTGGGKSLCYQIPALMLDGITLVVSPLISLMKDQVMALKSSGVAAAYINSSLTPAQIELVYRNVELGKYKIIYIAPERLLTAGFLHAVSKVKISMLCVDEAHCISQWGQDFRPSYLRITDFINRLPYRPVVSAFTATATAKVREDIIYRLGLQDAKTVITGFDRPNLRFEVMKPAKKPNTLLELVSARRNKCGIIYCATRKKVEDVCFKLQQAGFAATRYHAGLTDEERRQNQDDFVYDRRSIMVATNAFGMGIDKSNVGFVIHYNMPQSMEAYYQEAGRAGRDGMPADCILLYSASDIRTAKILIENPSEKSMLSPEEQQEVIEHDLARLDQIVDYCQTRRCLRGYILDYFGEVHPDECHNCSNCVKEVSMPAATPAAAPAVAPVSGKNAHLVLACIDNVYQELGRNVSTTLIVRILRQSKDKRIFENSLDLLPLYGALRYLAKEDIYGIMADLREQRLVKYTSDHGIISLTAKGRKELQKKATAARSSANTELPQYADADLLQVLKDLRWQLAQEAGVPAYVVFSNATLQDMAEKAPRYIEEFLQVSGVGQHKAEKYGKVFLQAINDYSN